MIISLYKYKEKPSFCLSNCLLTEICSFNMFAVIAGLNCILTLQVILLKKPVEVFFPTQPAENT